MLRSRECVTFVHTVLMLTFIVDPADFDYRSEGRYLKYAFRARFKDQASREEISDRRGIRWSILNLLPGWFPASNGPPDKMHASYLGMSYGFAEALALLITVWQAKQSMSCRTCCMAPGCSRSGTARTSLRRSSMTFWRLFGGQVTQDVFLAVCV